MNIGIINKLALSCCLILAHLFAFGQNQVGGKVIDAHTEEPLAGAFVIGMSSTSQKCFTYTDSEGEFNLKVPKGVTIDAINVSLLGYATNKIKYDGQSIVLVKLTEKKTELAASKVTSSAVTEKGDTLIYSIGAFKDGNEKVLSDLLTKLPDVAVTSSGGIVHNGSYINKFYVEGMDLMGNRYGVVTNNLNADDISYIEIYKNHQPVKALEGVSRSERSAINIVLKESAKNSWLFTGNAAIGAPAFPLFDAKAMFTRFSKKSQSLFLIKGNNIGNEITKEIREQMYFGKSGAFLISDSDIDSDFRTMLTYPKSLLPISEEYWYDNVSAISSLNHIARLDSSKTLRLSFNLARERYSEATYNASTISFSDGSSLVLSQGDSLSDISTYLSGTILYENNAPKKFVSNDLSISFQGKNETSEISGTSEYHQKYHLPSVKLSDTFMRTFRLGDKKALDLKSENKLVRNTHSAVFKDAADSSKQTYGFTSLSSDNKLSYKVNISSYIFDVTTGLALRYIDIATTLNDGLRGFGNDKSELSVFSVKPNVNLSTMLNFGNAKAMVSFPFALNYLAVANSNNVIYPEFSPRISFKYNISKALEWDINSRYTVSRSGEETLLNDYVMKDYRTFAKRDSLQRTNTFFANMTLKYSDFPSMFFASINGDFVSSRKNRSSSGIYSSDCTISYYLPITSGYMTYGVCADMKKYFGVKLLTVEVRGGLSEMDTDCVLQGVEVKYYQFSKLFNLHLTSNPAKWISMDFSVDIRADKITGDSEAETSSLRLKGNVNLKPIDNLTIGMVGDYLKENIPGVEISNTPLLKSSVSYSFPKYTVFAECRNLLNVKEYRRETVSTFITNSTITKLRGRQFLVGIRMSL